MRFHERPMVYVAGPYTEPDPVENTHKAIVFADRLHATGKVACFVPHQNLLWHIVKPHEALYWYDHDLAFLKRCDAMFRMEGYSPGADDEEKFAGHYGIPVFFDQHELLKWAENEGRVGSVTVVLS